MPINPSWVLVTSPSKSCYQAFLNSIGDTHHCLSRVGIILVSAIPLPQSTSKALASLKIFLFQNTVYLSSTTPLLPISTPPLKSSHNHLLPGSQQQPPLWLPCVFFPAAIKIHSTHHLKSQLSLVPLFKIRYKLL